MIDNPRSPRVRGVAKLAKRDARSSTGLFLLEGPQAVSEALRYRPELLVELYGTPTALDRYPDIAQAAASAGIDVEFVTEEVLDSMADTVTPQGIVAACKQFPTSVKDLFANGPN
jgi:TrmH family RNA methyltransferase